jgi:SAM-dependent methyltransferase
VGDDAHVSVTARYASGSGPGAITPDGCAVELYSLLPPGETEADVIASVAPAGSTVLELGSGAGRVTHALVQRGLAVVAVDESAEMLARIVGAETVQSTIEELRLHRRFDVVVLGSHLVNVPDDGAARALLQACARHVAADGHVLIERRPPEWFDAAADMQVERRGIVYTLSGVSRHDADVVSATVTYETVHGMWSHSFTSRQVDDARLETLLGNVGLALVGFVDDARTWAHARAS